MYTFNQTGFGFYILRLFSRSRKTEIEGRLSYEITASKSITVHLVCVIIMYTICEMYKDVTSSRSLYAILSLVLYVGPATDPERTSVALVEYAEITGRLVYKRCKVQKSSTATCYTCLNSSPPINDDKYHPTVTSRPINLRWFVFRTKNKMTNNLH